MDTLLANIDLVIKAMLSAIGENSTNVDAITIDTVAPGSTQLTGSATPSSGAVGASATSLGSSTDLGGFPVTSSSVTA